ncbi:hypothetical protein ABPG75_003112 [Micractinium tetrahymenae]
MALREAKDGAWTYKFFEDLFADPAICIISYCLPCVTYGQNAETVHGPAGSCVNHGLKYYLYSCICLCGLVSGPTRKALRGAYKLPAEPAGLGAEANTDCIVHTIPCTACFALCQEANEIKARKVTAPVDPRPFDWAPTPSSAPAPAATTAPAQADMSKGEPAAAPAAPAAQ